MASLVFCLGVKKLKYVSKQGAEGNISIKKGGSDSRTQKSS